MNRFYIVDVFAESKYGGNQLAVVLLDEPLDGDEMQAIAREIGFSESTFVDPQPLADGAFAVRIFTPAREIPFAGHPSLGTAAIIRRAGLGTGDEITLDLMAGRVPVRCDASGENVYWMTQLQPEFGPLVDRAAVARVLGLGETDIDRRLPVEQVSTGLAHIIVPLTSLATLQGVRVGRDAYFELIAETWAKNIMVFAPEPHQAGRDLSIRMFADYLGIPEDPATGSGYGCLLAYLVRHRYWGSPQVSIQSEQGYEIGRPSLLHGRATEADGRYSIEVGGKVVVIATGVWHG